MDKIKLYISRHLLKIGVLMFLLTIILIGINFGESRLGINGSDLEIKQYVNNIDKLGIKTYQIIIDNKETNNLYSLYEEYSIDDVRYSQIKNYFKVGKNYLRKDMYVISLMLMVIFSAIFTICVLRWHINNLYNKLVIGNKIKNKLR